MHVIDVEFRRLCDWSIPELLGELGVYVLWNGRAKRRPTYVGEGSIVPRLVEHHRRFLATVDGYAAILSTEGVSHQRAKAHGTIVEAVLLYVAEDTDRAPAVNVATGNRRDLEDIFRRHGTLKINVRGLDPLRPPEVLPTLQEPRAIVLRKLRNGDIAVKHGWRLRRIGS